jgi:Na+(H+)/acetate symporter ActP
MQFLILFIGTMVYVFYLFFQAPIFFNTSLLAQTKQSENGAEIHLIEEKYSKIHEERKQNAIDLSLAFQQNNEKLIQSKTQALKETDTQIQTLRKQAIEVIKKTDNKADTNDTNYIFLNFVRDYLPTGLVGLLIAVIIFASMSSTSAELNALASTTMIDFYKRIWKPEANDQECVKVSKWMTFLWGIYAIFFAMFANRLGTLIEAVNILGSLVYGTILGIFLSAFFLKKVTANATFIAALLSETLILYCYFFTDIPFLWYNVIGCLTVMGLGLLFQEFFRKNIHLEDQQ